MVPPADLVPAKAGTELQVEQQQSVGQRDVSDTPAPAGLNQSA